MAKRRESGIDIISSLPWPVGIVIGLVAYVGIRYGIGWLLAASTNPVTAAMGHQAQAGIYAPFAWLALGASWLGALFSCIKQRQRRQLLDTQTGLDSLRALSWRQFEVLVGEAFRRQSYSVQETGQGGADGGIDLVLRKAGAITLVQCKQWRSRQVTVNVVREMYGLLAHHGAIAVKIVAIGSYTDDARRFAEGKPIELIHGEALLAMIRAVQTPLATADSSPVTKTAAPDAQQPHRSAINPLPHPAPAEALQRNEAEEAHGVSSSPDCPRCGNAMVQRFNKQTKDRFWGCTKFPRCMGTRSA